MSSICGVFFLDRKPVEDDVIDGMLKRMGPFEADAVGQWHDGSVGLAVRALNCTTAPSDDELPVKNSAGTTWTVADAQLDNREELFDLLDNPKADRRDISDCRLVSMAYDRWGVECVERMLGDFAFAIWDADKRRMFCARDHMGLRPFFYCLLPGKSFVFASEMPAVGFHDFVPRVVNELAVVDIIIQNHRPRERTLYRDIHRLPSAHWLTVEPSEHQKKCYWSLDPTPTLRLPGAQDYVDGLRDVFTEAVNCRVDTAKKCATHLSGGLDSSAVTVVAARRVAEKGNRLRTYAWGSRPVEGWNFVTEEAYVKAVVEQEKTDHRDVWGERRDLEFKHEEGYKGPRRPKAYADHETEIRDNAAANGIRTILSGWGGDELATFNGRGYYAELVIKARWLKFYREFSRRCKMRKENFRKQLRWHVFEYLVPFRFHRMYERRFADYRGDPLKRLSLRPEFIERFAIEDHWQKEAFDLGPSLRGNQLQLITGGHLQRRIERWSTAASRFNLKYRFPFLDKRVLEYCMSVPPRHFMGDGWNRYLFRRAMEGILPEIIRWRFEKLPQVPAAPRSSVRGKERMLERMAKLEENQAIGEYFDLNEIRKAIEDIPEEEELRKQFQDNPEPRFSFPKLQGFSMANNIARILAANGLDRLEDAGEEETTDTE